MATTRTAHAAAQEKAATTKAKSDANPRPKRRRAPVEVRHVRPVRPERSQFPAGVPGTREFREAEGKYEAALLAYAAEAGAPEEIASDYAALESFFNDRDGNPVSTKKAPAKSTGKPATKKASTAKAEPKKSTAKAAPAKSTKKASAPAAGDDGVNWSAKATADRIVKAKQSGKSIKEIAEAMGLPAEHRSWYRVSMVWRREADARGLDRPRLSADAIEARKNGK